MSASSTARPSVVAGLENALKKMGCSLADRSFKAANTAEIAQLGTAIADRFKGKTVTVLDPELFGDPRRGETIDDAVLNLEVRGEGRGHEAIEHPSISFRKERRFVFFGPEVYKIDVLTA